MGHGNFVLIFFWIFFLSFFVFYFFLTFFDRQRWATILVDNKNGSNQQQVSTLSPQITRVHACDPKTIVSIRILYALRESLYRTMHMKCSLKRCSYDFRIIHKKAHGWSLFLMKLQLEACNFIKKKLQHRCFSINIAKFIRTHILKNLCEQLLRFIIVFYNHLQESLLKKKFAGDLFGLR